jgi:hypothetical protein
MTASRSILNSDLPEPRGDHEATCVLRAVYSLLRRAAQRPVQQDTREARTAVGAAVAASAEGGSRDGDDPDRYPF